MSLVLQVFLLVSVLIDLGCWFVWLVSLFVHAPQLYKSAEHYIFKKTGQYEDSCRSLPWLYSCLHNSVKHEISFNGVTCYYFPQPNKWDRNLIRPIRTSSIATTIMPTPLLTNIKGIWLNGTFKINMPLNGWDSWTSWVLYWGLVSNVLHNHQESHAQTISRICSEGLNACTELLDRKSVV